MEIKELKAEGHSVRAISRLTGLSRNTIRRVLRGEHSLQPTPRRRVSKLDPFKDYLRQRYMDYQLSAVRLLDEIAGMGYAGSLVTLRRYLQTLKPEVARLRRVTVRFETPPGKQAQADWAYCGKFVTPDGRRLSVYTFVMVLSFSRRMFITFTLSMKMRELLACHQQAFDYFGGWPQTLLYDNMKQVKLSRSQWNEQFLDFAQHHGFVAKTHSPYRPRTKGKVERMVEYVKDNFLAGRTFDDLADLNAQGRHWLDYTANSRVHATTQRVPNELFAQELLIPVNSIQPYRYINPVARTVNFESMVHYSGSRYSVPPDYAGKTVAVAAQGGQIVVRCGDTVIAEHRQAVRSGQCIVNKEHIAAVWKLTAQQMRPPPVTRWNITFQPCVQCTPLSVFETVSA